MIKITLLLSITFLGYNFCVKTIRFLYRGLALIHLEIIWLPEDSVCLDSSHMLSVSSTLVQKPFSLLRHLDHNKPKRKGQNSFKYRVKIKFKISHKRIKNEQISDLFCVFFEKSLCVCVCLCYGRDLLYNLLTSLES